MGFGVRQAGLLPRRQDQQFRFRSLTSIEGAKDLEDLACRLKLLMDDVLGQLNSQVAPILPNFNPDNGRVITDDDSDTVSFDFDTWSEKDAGTFENESGGKPHPDQMLWGFGGFRFVGIDYTSATEKVWFFRVPAGQQWNTGDTDNPPDALEPHKVVSNTITDITAYVVRPGGRYALVYDDTTPALWLIDFEEETVEDLGDPFTTAGGAVLQNSPIWDTINDYVYWLDTNSDRLWVMKFDPAGVSIRSITDIGTLMTGTDPRQLHFIPGTNNTKLVVGSKSSISTWDVEDVDNVTLLDEDNPRTTFTSPPAVSHNLWNPGVECDVGILGSVIGIQWNSSTDKHVSCYTFDDSFTLTAGGQVSLGTVGDSSHHAGMFAYITEDLYAFITGVESSKHTLHVVDVSDPSSPTLSDNLDLTDAHTGVSHQTIDPTRHAFVRWGNVANPDDPKMVELEGVVVDSGGSKSQLTLDRLILNPNCFIPLVLRNSNLIPLLNADKLDDAELSDILAMMPERGFEGTWRFADGSFERVT